jgi:PAS domain S-box-containing protein
MDRTAAQLILHDRKIAYAITDRELKVVEVSGSVSTFHHRRKSFLGRSLLELVPELVGNEAVLADILGGNLSRFELKWINRETDDGDTVYLTTVDLPYRNRQGKISGILHVTQDVTDMALLEQQLIQRRNELRILRRELAQRDMKISALSAEEWRLEELKSTFVSVAAHALRTPIASISGFIEVLLDEDAGSLTPQQREYLEIIEHSASRLLTIAQNLLLATKLEAGRVELVLQPWDLAAIAEDAAAQHELQLEAKSQHLTLRAASNLPPALCDERRMAQILAHLLDNASNYTPAGGLITLSLDCAEDEEGYLHLSISDSGVGIPAEDRSRLFDRFFQAKSSELIEVNGAGLGLYIVQALVELHGGRIWLESSAEGGTTFHLTVPIAD